jgi:hypothetical protein
MVRVEPCEEATTMAMGVSAIPRYERYFRAVAEVDVDKDDLKRFSGFVFERTIHLLIRAQANAKGHLRDTIELWDLPITKGQERIHEIECLDRDIRLEPSRRPGRARPRVQDRRLEAREPVERALGALVRALRAAPLTRRRPRSPVSSRPAR